MIHFEHIYQRYESGHEALTDINFHLAKGEMTFLTGHSGAGKSTILKLLTAIENPSRGTLIVNDFNLSNMPRWRIPYLRRQIGVIFQDHQMLYDRTIFDNVALPLVIEGYRHNKIKRRVHAALDKVGLLKKEKLFPRTLSSGEQQRVGIARAVVNKPPILLADEPTGNLDPELSEEIMKLFGQFNEVGMTSIIATHNLELVTRMNYPVLNLKGGRIISNDLNKNFIANNT